MTDRPKRPRFTTKLARSVVPAYLAPMLTASAQGVLVDNQALLDAAPTTIAIPSAAAAALVTIRDQRRYRSTSTVDVQRARRAALGGALVGLLPAAAVSGWMVGNGFTDATIFLYAPGSAMLGGAIAAATSARAVRRHRTDADGSADRGQQPHGDVDAADVDAAEHGVFSISGAVAS